jgi:uncharacterized protein YjbJ (UPF0337 family)
VPVIIPEEDEPMANEDKNLTQRGTENSIKGKLKDAAGGLTGDSSLQAEGKWDQVKGKVRDTVGKVQRDLDEDR